MNQAAPEAQHSSAPGAIVKRGILLAFVLILLAFLVGTTPSNGQETLPPSAGSNNAGPPNTPSVTKATTCTEKNGNPCPEWVHKLIGQYPPSPESEIQTEQDPVSVHFWTYRGWQDPPLRTNKQVFHSKVFLAAHIGGAIAMIAACRTKNSGESCGSEVPGAAAMFGMDYLQFRFVGGPNAIAAPIYEMIHDGRASTR